MSINKSDALNMFKLPSVNWTKKDLEDAFNKMIRRYPPTQFPEKSIDIQKAYDLLAVGNRYWDDLINSSNLDLSWCQELIKEQLDKDILVNTKKIVNNDLAKSLMRHMTLKISGSKDIR